MALISFGKQEIDELNLENERLREEVSALEARCNIYVHDIEEKNQIIQNHKNYIKQIEGFVKKYEKLMVENRDQNIILNNPERSSKATIENLKLICNLKKKGNSYRQISKKIFEATGEDLAYSTVRYLYKKYIEKDEQWS
jgi:GTPase involved in cell partitioning and DNA repair